MKKKRGSKLSKSALKEIRDQYLAIKQEADEVFKVWSDLSGRVRSLEQVLSNNGLKIKTDEDAAKSAATKSKTSASTLRAAIAEILQSKGTAVKASEIREQLRKKKFAFGQPYFWRVLGRMEGKGTIKRVGTGLYQLQNGSSS